MSQPVDLLHATQSERYELGVEIGQNLVSEREIPKEVWDDYAVCLYYTKQYEKAFDAFQSGLNYPMSHTEAYKNIHSAQLCVSKELEERYVGYTKYVDRAPQEYLVTFTMTTCKRFDLFERTMNSFLTACLDCDRIGRWLVVDDNSSDDDREKMRAKYPFIEFYFKTPAMKGHPQSMNIIRRLVTTPYFFHMEDDWVFYVKRRYISDCLDVLHNTPANCPVLGQCLINKGYAETSTDIDLKGGLPMTVENVRYFIHEHASTDHEQKELLAKYGECRNCWYWPHFSLRPGLSKTAIMDDVGLFNEKIAHFEMEFAKRYVQKGYSSAYLEGIYSRHIGRLTSEKGIPNAYDLNNESQFTGKTALNFSTVVVNLERRPDRYAKFMERLQAVSPALANVCVRFNAVDGKRLVSTPQLQRLFDGNDYNMMVGAVGCALSHICLTAEFLARPNEEACLIFEDDAEFLEDFQQRFNTVIDNLPQPWDLIYLGHHLRKQFDYSTPDQLTITIEQWSSGKSLMYSMGGTFAYMISRAGAEKLLKFIEIFGMRNCIDTVQQRSCDFMRVFYITPCLSISECYPTDQKVDTDIQRDDSSLSVNSKQRILDEQAFYVSRGVSIPTFTQTSTPEELENLKKTAILPWYVINGNIFVSGEACQGVGKLVMDGEVKVKEMLLFKEQ